MRNWKEYNQELIQRGSLTFLIDPKIFKAKKTKTLGRPRQFSDALILMLMMTKIHYRLAYRALQGFVRSLATLSNQPFSVPTYSLVCKRAATLELPKISVKRPSVIAIDASGMKVYGEGEWKIKVHGKSKKRKWLKIHVAMDIQSQEIVAQTTTTSDVHDSKALDPLLQQLHGCVEYTLADGAYDGRASRDRIAAKGSKALIPPPKNARVRGRDPDRDHAIQVIRGLGGDRQAKSLWAKLTGYSARCHVESLFSQMKRLLGERLFSKKFDKQVMENHLRCLLLNKINSRKRGRRTLGIFASVGRSRAQAV